MQSVLRLIVRNVICPGLAFLVFARMSNAAGEGPHHAVTVVDGSSLNVVFTAPEAETWNWRLTVNAGGNWCHVVGSQRPNTAPWAPQAFGRRSGYWSVPVTPDAPERQFQIRFYGRLEPCTQPAAGGGGGAAPVTGEWEVQAETSDYYVLPEWINLCSEGSVTLRAVNGLGNDAQPVSSSWSVVPADGMVPTPLPDGSTVAFNLSIPGEYIATGRSLRDPGLSDTAFINVIRLRIAEDEVTACASSGGVTISLTDDSVTGRGGRAEWFGGPGDALLGTGRSITIHTAGWPAGVHTITVRSSLLPDCGDACELNVVAATLRIPALIGLNDLVPACDDPAGFPSGFTVTASEFDKDDDLEVIAWSVEPADIGDVAFNGDARVRVLRRGETEIEANPRFPASEDDVALKIEGIRHSVEPDDAVVRLSLPDIDCRIESRTTVVQMLFDRSGYNRINPFPQVDIIDVTGLQPGSQATVRYRVAGDVLNPAPTYYQVAFAVQNHVGTFEFRTPPFVNRLGNAGWGSLRYTVSEQDGTRTARWRAGEPSHAAMRAAPAASVMRITLRDALAETPDDALAHLVSQPAFAGPVTIAGARPEYTIANVRVLARPPSSPAGNEIAAAIGCGSIVQTLHGKAQASAAVLDLAGRRTVGVNDRFGPGDPGDDAGQNRNPGDPDLMALELKGVPDCLQQGTLVWGASGGIRLISHDGSQVGNRIQHSFNGGPPTADMLRVLVEGREASRALDDASVAVRVLPTGGFVSGNPRAYRERPLDAVARVTVSDLRWTGWKADDTPGRTEQRTDWLSCDLDLRPAVRIDGPASGAVVRLGSPLTVSGSVRSMTEIVRDIHVNGEPVAPQMIRFMGLPVAGMTEASVKGMTDRPPPYVVTFTHQLNALAADRLRVEARGGGGPWPGVAERLLAIADCFPTNGSVGTVADDLPGDPAYLLPSMESFFNWQEEWRFLYKTEVDHFGSGKGVVDCFGIAGAQPGGGLYRLRLPLVFVPGLGANAALPGPGLLLYSTDGTQPVEARYDNGVATGRRLLFPVDIRIEDAGGMLPVALEWSPGAVLEVGATQGLLRVSNPFAVAGLPADARLTLSARRVASHPNPFAAFPERVWTSGQLTLTPVLPLATATAGVADFEAVLSSPTAGILGKDRVRVTVAAVDLCVDSRNERGFAEPEPSPAIEAIEDDPERPGKIIVVNANDGDGDRIPDYADGFELLPGNTNTAVCLGEDFTPIVFTIPESLDIAAARVHLSYSASDPRLVTTNAAGRFVLPPDGHLRIWTVDGDVRRQAREAWAGNPGHYLPPTPEEGIPAAALGFSDTRRKQTFYIEGIRPSETAGDQRIVFEVAPDAARRGPQGPRLRDAVRLTIATVEITVDGNRDGIMQFLSDGHEDETTPAIPYRFWLNTDEDVVKSGWPIWSDPDPERIPPKTPDCGDTVIQSKRDLEDFTRLHIQFSETLLPFIDREDVILGLKWVEAGSDGPAIRLFAAAESDGGLKYIKSDSAANLHLLEEFRNALVDRHSRTVLQPTANAFDFAFKAADIRKPAVFMLFEGVKRGVGAAIVPVLMDASGNILGEGNAVWIDLYHVEELYMRAHAKPTRLNFPLPYLQNKKPSFPYAKTPTGGLIVPPQNLSFASGFDVRTTPSFIPSSPVFSPAPDEQNKCIVFVHGIDLNVDAVACYTASFYKRLWWEGYKGRLAVYRWSTPLSGFTKDGIFIFSDGEFLSYHSALGLKGYVESIRQQMPGVRLSLAAHSLGNACAGNALRMGMTVDSYIMLEAAMPLAAYFPPPVAEMNSSIPAYVQDQGYPGFLSDIKRNIANFWVNYHNDQDFWLATGETSLGIDIHWARWNAGFKPFDPLGPEKYKYDKSLGEGSRCKLDLLGFNVHRPVEDICEALAFVARSGTHAVGAEAAGANPIPSGDYGRVNLWDYGFRDGRPDHSGQFQRNIQHMYGGDGVAYEMPLYRKIIKDLNME